MLGFYALVWLWLIVIGWTRPSALAVQGSGLLLMGSYWGLWSWFCELRKLPSTPLALADRLSVCIFVVTGPPGLAASLAGPDAVKQWDWLAVASLVTLLLTIGVVMLGAKGPALLQELAKDAPSWAVAWLRVYSEPSVLVAVALGYVTVMLTFEPLAPDWLACGSGSSTSPRCCC
jgi:RsiW-degrading membrane proteinase PrsW (M82 family)